MLDDPSLASEIQNDPQKLGYAAAGGDSAVASLINAPNAAWSVWLQVPITAVLKWAASGPMQQVNDYANNTTNNAALRSICMAALRMFGAAAALDLTDPAINGAGGLLQTLESNGIITAAQLSSLLAPDTGSKSPCSRAEVLWGVGVTIAANDIARAFGRSN